MPEPRSIVVIGRGAIGSALGHYLRSFGVNVVHVAKHRGPADVSIDLSTADGRRGLSAFLRATVPDAVVLAHGPMDVDWCQSHEPQAIATHEGTADAVARSGAPAVLVSSDAVFSGDAESCTTGDEPSPTSAYGRAKLAAERCAWANPRTAIVRLSYVYGRPRLPLDPEPRFDIACLLALSSGRIFVAPIDQHFTPVFVDDVTRVLAAVVLGGVTGTFHLGGPRRLSRFDFAREIGGCLGVPTDSVVPALRSETRWASRPTNSCLRSSDFGEMFGWPSFQPLDPAQGIRMLVSAAGPSQVGSP